MSDPRAVVVDGQAHETAVAPDLAVVLKRRWLVIVTCAVLGLVAAQLFTSVTTQEYEAQSTLLLIAGEEETAPSGGRARTVDVDTWATVARSTELLEEVAGDLGLDLSVVQSRTSATAAPTGDILVLASRAPSIEQAVEGASVYSNRFLSDRQELLDLETETGRVVVEPSTAVTRTGLGKNIILLSGLLAGALVGFILALLRDRYDDRYRSVYAFEHFGVEEIARVPYVNNDDEDEDGQPSDLAAAYGRLLARLAFGRHPDPDVGRAVLIIPVESTTIPDDAGSVVAKQLRSSARGRGITASIARNSRPATVEAGRRSTTEDEKTPLGKALAKRDLVLVARPALDNHPEGIGLAGVVDGTVLLVSSDTRATVITQVIDDLDGVGATDVKIAVVTGVKQSRLSTPAFWRQPRPRIPPRLRGDIEED